MALETDAQRRWFFAHLDEGMRRIAGKMLASTKAPAMSRQERGMAVARTEGLKGSGKMTTANKLEKPIVGPTGAKIIGYEWRSMEGERWSEGRQEMVAAQVSNWAASDVSEGTGREIVHVFVVEHPDGTVTNEGINSAQQILGIQQSRLKTIAKKEREARRYRAKQESTEVRSMEAHAEESAGAASRSFRMRNISALERHGESVFSQSVLLEKDGKFYRTTPVMGEILERAGWSRKS